MSMTKKKPEDELWFVHAPLKNEKRPIVQTVQPSNIPYLNGVMDTEEDLAKRPTIWFRETDSDFVKLSKLGGREDLLIHKNKPGSKEPVAYPIPNWWTDMLSEVRDKERDENADKKPYIFQIPAWFAHQDRSQDEDTKNVIPNYPYTRESKPQSYPKQNEPIEEPRKYGQLRNFLNPVVVKDNKPNDYVVYKGKRIEDATTMPKLMGNYYQEERPKDFDEWKSKYGNNSKALKKNAPIR